MGVAMEHQVTDAPRVFNRAPWATHRGRQRPLRPTPLAWALACVKPQMALGGWAGATAPLQSPLT